MNPQPVEQTHVPNEKFNKLKVNIQGLIKGNEELQLSLNQVTLKKDYMEIDLDQKTKKLLKKIEIIQDENKKRKIIGEELRDVAVV